MTAATDFIYRFVTPDTQTAPQSAAARARAIQHSPAIRSVAWRDLCRLTWLETAHELTIMLPWLAASLIAAHYGWWPVALACSFMTFLTALRQCHNGDHLALGLTKRQTDWFLFVMSIVILGANHAIKYNHILHHRHCLEAEDIEGRSAEMSALGALAYGPLFPIQLHIKALTKAPRDIKAWVIAELVANAMWIGLVLFVFDVPALVYHVVAMAAAQCLTSFFCVWTVHNHAGQTYYPARTLRGRIANAVSYNMFLHTEHHLFPAVPTRKLHVLASRLDKAMGRLKDHQVF